MIRVLGPPYFHHDHVPALRRADTFKPRCLVSLFIKTRTIRLFPPTVLPLEGLKLQPPLALGRRFSARTTAVMSAGTGSSTRSIFPWTAARITRCWRRASKT